MPKPTVFFSHSSKDKQVITKLKELLVKKTGGSIDFFSSSDGQSISFGKNWVHSIEKALTETSIMFVFLTPNSLYANWIYFESGFSYSKGVQVIPVGFLGVDLNQIEPPLSLLQGFNVNSFEGLNNMIGVINIRFDSSHNESFIKDEFCLLEELGTNGKNYSSNNVLNIVDSIYLNLSNGIPIDNQRVGIIKTNLEHIVGYFKDNEIDYRIIRSTIETHGLMISPYSINLNVSPINYGINIDPFLYKVNFKHLKKIIIKLYDNTLNILCFQIRLKRNFDLLYQTFHISSRLKPYDVGFSESDRAFKYKNSEFKVDMIPDAEGTIRVLNVVSSLDNLGEFEMEELIGLLIDSGVIFDA